MKTQKYRSHAEKRALWLSYTALRSLYIPTSERRGWLRMTQRIERWRAAVRYQMQPGDLRAMNEAKQHIQAIQEYTT